MNLKKIKEQVNVSEAICYADYCISISNNKSVKLFKKYTDEINKGKLKITVDELLILLNKPKKNITPS